jgi:hypothetical protein
MLDHLDRSLSFYGSEDGLVLFRKFAASYLEPYHLDPKIRRRLLTEINAGEFRNQVDEVFNSLNS